MTHTAGLLSLPCTAQGGTVVILGKPEPALMLAAIASYRVSEFFLPPTVIYKLLELPGIEQADFSSVKYLMYGAAPAASRKASRTRPISPPLQPGSRPCTRPYWARRASCCW